MRKQTTVNREQFIPHFSVLFATCCTSLSVEEATRRMNQISPTGIRGRWQLATKENLPEGFEEDNPWPCNGNPNWKHMYFVC